ncbi:phosphatidylinositide phosphatase SAC2-like [Oscarella lobularis]|uniref:phosphatidylinositide phosphatase SAC2-like n=1 Tax=Oscarella lobularis TaxID=121494 RepID=UPI003314254E
MDIDFCETPDAFILKRGDSSLWCSRIDGRLEVRPAIEETGQMVGVVYGYLGSIRLTPQSDKKLVVVSECTPLGLYPGRQHMVYRIDKIALITLSPFPFRDYDMLGAYAPKRRDVVPNPKLIADYQKARGGESEKMSKEKEKIEKRCQEELLRMFNGSESFYFSNDFDLTKSLNLNDEEKGDTPIWRQADPTYFWNYHMLGDLIETAKKRGPQTEKLYSPWLLPIIQGYIEINQPLTEPPQSSPQPRKKLSPLPFSLALISRRSRFRAGTRYKRRGIDAEGHVANHVETEQILAYGKQRFSFVLLRGSIPIYWSQPGTRYRPPPQLDRTPDESQSAFRRHFDDLIARYDRVVAINLVEQSGREGIVGSAYDRQAESYDNEKLACVSFDFHKHCKGMHYENVALLVDSLELTSKKMRFFWKNADSVLSRQIGVFRVNCMDCLDRTNVVQSALARAVLEIILFKISLKNPDENLAASWTSIFQDMWANNGDAISRQYAGTDALKGDYTRTGERKWAGVVRDGLNSANRFYVNLFRDRYRQDVIDVMQGERGDSDVDKEWTMVKEEDLTSFMRYCQDRLVPENEAAAGGCQTWALLLIQGEAGAGEEEAVFMVTAIAFYVVKCDVDGEDVKEFEKLPIEDVERIIVGLGDAGRECMQIECAHDIRRTFTTLRSSQGGDVLKGIIDALARVRKAEIGVDTEVIRRRIDARTGKGLGRRAVRLSSQYLIRQSAKMFRGVRRRANAMSSPDLTRKFAQKKREDLGRSQFYAKETPDLLVPVFRERNKSRTQFLDL